MNPLETWSPILNVWQHGQMDLPNVHCWSSFDNEKSGGIRPQNLLQHSFSVALLGKILIHQLRPFVTLDEPLLLTAFIIHDLGKAELGLDTPHPSKSDWSEIKEYEAFTARCSPLEAGLYDELKRAFLLKCVGRNPERFPDEARAIIAELVEKRPMEVLAFDAAERWDYLLFALEQYKDRQNDVILSRVLQTHSARLDELAEKLPGFGQTVWTTEMKTWKEEFLKTH